jgi:hypothetical protein
MTRDRILKRKLEALFPVPSERETVLSILACYGTEKHEREPDRVKIAILRLAGTEIDKIRKYTQLAKEDYRDILSWAEYPRQSKSWSLLEGPEKKKLRELDRANYEKWLDD